jgi:hypothetical protein
MNEQQLAQWAKEHGGFVGQPETSAGGDTTYRAASGDYVVVRRDGSIAMRGFAPGAPSAAQTPSAAAESEGPPTVEETTTPAPGPITTLSQDQAGARLTEISQSISGQLRYVPQQKIRRVPNPAADPNNPAFVFGSPPTIDTPYTIETWYDPKTNTPVFSGERRADGSFNVTLDTTPRQTQTAGYGTSVQIEGTPDASKPNGFDNDRPIRVTRNISTGQVIKSEPLTADDRKQWEKDTGRALGAASRQDVPGHPGISHVVSKDANGNTDDHYEDAQGNRVAAPTDSKNENVIYRKNPTTGQLERVTTTTVNGTKSENVTPVDPKDRTQVGTRTTVVNGKTTKVTKWRLPDGSEIETTDEEDPGPGKGQTIVIDGVTYWAQPNADPSKPPKLTPMQPGGNAQPTDNGPQFSPGMTASDYLTQRRTYWMDQRRAGVSQKDIDAGWEKDKEIATARQNEAQTAATQQNQRLSTAMSGFNQAATSAAEINRYLPPGSDLGGKYLEATLGLQRGQAQRMGGYGPTSVAPMTVPPAPIGPAPSSQVAAIPPPPTAAPAPDAAIPGVRVGAAMTGTGVDAPVAPAAPAAQEAARQVQAAGPPPTPGEPGGPALQTTYPTYQPSTVPTPSAYPAADEFGRTPAGGGAVVAQPDFNPAPGAPGHIPGAPVGMTPELPVLAHSMAAAQVPWRMTEEQYRAYKAAGVPDEIIWSTPGAAA